MMQGASGAACVLVNSVHFAERTEQLLVLGIWHILELKAQMPGKISSEKAPEMLAVKKAIDGPNAQTVV